MSSAIIGRAAIPLLIGVAACNRPHSDPDARDAGSSARHREATRAMASPDTAVYVARQAGHAVSTLPAVMQLRVTTRDAHVALENAAGQRAAAGRPSEAMLGIPGARVVPALDVDSGPPVPGTPVEVMAPVLAGERYLVEATPRGRRDDSLTVSLSADAQGLMSARVALGDSTHGPALFEVVVTQRGLAVGPAIETVDLVPTCGTAHVIRSAGLADLYARYAVVESGEQGDVHLPPRDGDARYRSVMLRTATRGTVRLSYLGRVLATAPMPEGCPGP